MSLVRVQPGTFWFAPVLADGKAKTQRYAQPGMPTTRRAGSTPAAGFLKSRLINQAELNVNVKFGLSALEEETVSQFAQSGEASHLPGALVMIQEAGRHFGKLARVIGRSVHRKEHRAVVRIDAPPRLVPLDSREPKRGNKVIRSAVDVILPDDQLTRSPESLKLPTPRPTKIGSFLSRVITSTSAPQFPARRRLTDREFRKRQSRMAMAEASRKRNRKA